MINTTGKIEQYKRFVEFVLMCVCLYMPVCVREREGGGEEGGGEDWERGKGRNGKRRI